SNNVAGTSSTSAVSGPIILDNGQPGYSETGSWDSFGGGYSGAYRYASTSGSNSATWQAGNLAVGSYTLQASWPADNGGASNAPFDVYDGSTLLQTVRVDQSHSSTGTLVGGVRFATLGTFTISGGTVKIVLSSSGANSLFISADAVRIVPVPAATTDL